MENSLSYAEWGNPRTISYHTKILLQVSPDLSGAQHTDLQHRLEPVRALHLLDLRSRVDDQDLGSQLNVRESSGRHRSPMNEKSWVRHRLPPAFHSLSVLTFVV